MILPRTPRQVHGRDSRKDKEDAIAEPGNLAEIVARDLDALIVAINPSPQSAAVGHSFASPTNPFWRLLHRSGLTPVELMPSEECRLLDFGLGLTTTVVRPTRSASELSLAERRVGVERVRGVVAELQPRVVALLGVTLYPLFIPGGRSSGAGLKPERFEGSEVYVLPNPSGRNRAYPGFDRKLIWFEDLARHLESTAALPRTDSGQPSRAVLMPAPVF